MKATATLDESGTDEIVREFLDDPRLDVRHAAYMVYFDDERALDAVPLTIDFLNSEANTRRKRVFIGLLRRKNQAILDVVMTQLENVTSDDVRKVLQRPVRRRGAQE